MAEGRGARKRQRVSHDDEDDGKKTRGRPRVEGADETAADRRRTQIRLAQRAYRLRKETTISSLKVQVSALQTTIEEMNKTFLNFNDRAVASGVLQMSPDLGRELKAATEQFILFAKASHQSGDENSDSEIEEEPQNSSKTLPRVIEMEHQYSFSTLASSQSPESQPEILDIGMGYSLTYDDSTSAQPPAPTHVSSREFNNTMQMQTATTTGRYDDATSSFGLLQYIRPATSGATLAVAAPSDSQYQQYHVQVPSPTQTNVPSMIKTIPGDYTYSFQETTFARRLQRAALERGFHLLSNAEQRPHAYNRVFRLSLVYHSRDNLIAKFRAALSKDPGHSIETYQTPFIHLGGAGTHYDTGRVQNGYIVKPGPLQRQITLESVDGTGMPQEIADFDLTEYDGQWFDSNDVEGYLESKGLHIDPQSTFVEWQTDDDVVVSNESSTSADFFSSPSPSASGVETVASMMSPSPATPRTAQESSDWSEIGVWDNSASWDTAAAGWLMRTGDKTPDFLSSGWSSVDNPAAWDFSDTIGATFDDYGASHLADAVAPRPKTMRNVTIDVSKLIDELIKTGICLGRAPGFRKRDLDRALSSSIIQVF